MTAARSGWPVVCYRAADGTEPVDVFIDGLAPKVQVVLDNQIERIALFGGQLPFPHSSQVEGELRELRCHTATPCTASYTGARTTYSCCFIFSRSGLALSPKLTSRSHANDGPTSRGE